MLNILAIVFVLVAIYAIKAAVMLRSQDDVIGKSTSFSWMAPEAVEEGAVPAWAVEETKAESPATLHMLHHVQRARAF